MAYQPIQLPSVDPVQGYRDLAATLAASRESERQRDYQRAQILLQQRAQESEDARYARNAANAERQIASVERAQRANALEAALKEADPAKRMALLKMAGFQVEEGDEVKVPMGGIQQPQPGAAPPVSQPQGGSALPDALEQPRQIPGQQGNWTSMGPVAGGQLMMGEPTVKPVSQPSPEPSAMDNAREGLDRFTGAMGKGVQGVRELGATRDAVAALRPDEPTPLPPSPAAPPASSQGASGAAPAPTPEQMLSLGRKQIIRGDKGEVVATLDPMEKYQRDQQRQQVVENALGPAFEAYRPMIKSMLSIPDMDPKTVLSTVLERAERDAKDKTTGENETWERGYKDRSLAQQRDIAEMNAEGRERVAAMRRRKGGGGAVSPKAPKVSDSVAAKVGYFADAQASLDIIGKNGPISMSAIQKVWDNEQKMSAAGQGIGSYLGKTVGLIPKSRLEGLTAKEQQSMTEWQRYNDAVGSLLSGTGIGEKEYERRIQLLTPQPGDTPKTIQIKLQRGYGWIKNNIASLGPGAVTRFAKVSGPSDDETGGPAVPGGKPAKREWKF